MVDKEEMYLDVDDDDDDGNTKNQSVLLRLDTVAEQMLDIRIERTVDNEVFLFEFDQ